MAFVHGKSGRLLLDKVALSGKLRGWEAANELELADTTVEGDEAHRFTPGLVTGSLSLDGVFDNTVTVGEQDETLDTAKQASAASVISAAPDGFALGKRVLFASARESSYAVASPVADAVTFSAAWQSEGQTDIGVSLHDLTAETATTTGTSTALEVIPTPAGSAAHLHVTANTRDGSTTIKIQHSSDNVTFADLTTFAAVGAATTTSERATSTGTVNRHMRAVWTLAGTTGSITFVVAAARR